MCNFINLCEFVKSNYLKYFKLIYDLLTYRLHRPACLSLQIYYSVILIKLGQFLAKRMTNFDVHEPTQVRCQYNELKINEIFIFITLACFLLFWIGFNFLKFMFRWLSGRPRIPQPIQKLSLLSIFYCRSPLILLDRLRDFDRPVPSRVQSPHSTNQNIVPVTARGHCVRGTSRRPA